MSLSDQQTKAIQILSRGGSQDEATKAANVSRRTVIRWLKLPIFKEGLGATSNNRIKKTVEVIQQKENLEIENLVPRALQKVRDILEDDEARKTDVLRAAELIGKWAGLGQNTRPLAKVVAGVLWGLNRAIASD
jgi:hypothetical protein